MADITVVKEMKKLYTLSTSSLARAQCQEMFGKLDLCYKPSSINISQFYKEQLSYMEDF